MFRLEQRFRVCSAVVRHQVRHPRVAAVFRLVMEAMAHPPHHRVPPVNRPDQGVRPTKPMVASPEVRELMADYGTAAHRIELCP